MHTSQNNNNIPKSVDVHDDFDVLLKEEEEKENENNNSKKKSKINWIKTPLWWDWRRGKRNENDENARHRLLNYCQSWALNMNDKYRYIKKKSMSKFMWNGGKYLAILSVFSLFIKKDTEMK